jgi:hypothetical protein
LIPLLFSSMSPEAIVTLQKWQTGIANNHVTTITKFRSNSFTLFPHLSLWIQSNHITVVHEIAVMYEIADIQKNRVPIMSRWYLRLTSTK